MVTVISYVLRIDHGEIPSEVIPFRSPIPNTAVSIWVAPFIRQLVQTGNQQEETYRFESTVGVCYSTPSIVMATYFQPSFSRKHPLDVKIHHRLEYYIFMNADEGRRRGWWKERKSRRILVRLTNGSRYLQTLVSWRS